jgi:GrpB-like predicted nucleotidyltransferase (UPF0157 family)
MSRVNVQPYNPEWPRTYEQLRAQIWPVVQHAAMRIEHVGSTAVSGLHAKPVIDICIIVASRRDLPFVAKGLQSIGYTSRGECGVPEREVFRAPDGLPKHHLYASPRHSVSARNQVGLRDFLRAHPDAAAEYGDLKQRLAAQFPHDMERYIAGKTECVLRMLQQVGLSDEELASIRAINTGAAPDGQEEL